jgi:hypothetical protein
MIREAERVLAIASKLQLHTEESANEPASARRQRAATGNA